MKKLLLILLVLFFGNQIIKAQLNVGDLAFIGYNTDQTSASLDHDFSWITLTDIPAGEVIYFSEEGWNNITNTWSGNTEGHLTWTAPAGGVSCGTVIHIYEVGTSNVISMDGPGTISTSVSSGSGWNLSAGDQVLAYQGSGPETASPTFIAGVHGDNNSSCYNATTTWNDATCMGTGTANSSLPPGLTNGVNCVGLFPSPTWTNMEQDNAMYTGTLTGTSTVLRALINDPTNWSSNNTTPFNIHPSQYSPNVTCVASCTNPDVPTITPTSSTITCGGSTTLNWAGANLNDATNWHVYTTSCGTGQITSQSGTSLVVSPTTTTTYYIRGEDGAGCVDESTGLCGSVTVTVNPITVTFTALADLCVNAGVQTGLGGGSPTGGVYSGTGVTDDGNGMTYSFDPAAAGVGTHTITYTISGTCSGSANDQVEVFALPTVTFTALADLCVNAGVQTVLGGGSPTGGVYSGTGVTDDGNGTTYSFDPAAAGVGTHTITYSFSDGNGCSGSANDQVEVFTLPTVTFTALADLCVNAGVQTVLGGGSPTGGVYSGAGVTDDGNGMTYSFDPAAAGVGTHTITYSFSDGNGCSGSANDQVEVFASPTSPSAANVTTCDGDDVILSATGSGSGDVVYYDNAFTEIGRVTMPPANTTYNLGALATGSDTYYAAEDNGSCVSSFATISTTVLPALTGSVTNTICNEDSMVVNGTTYNAANPTGTEVFTNVGPNNCDSTVTINLNVLPALTGSVTNTICNTDSVVVNGTTYNAANPSGTEVFTNVGPNNCDSTVTVNLTVDPAIDVTITNTSPTLTANQTGATYQWVDCDNANAPIPTETSQSFTATVNGNYAVEITVGSCTETSACENVTGVGIKETIQNTVAIYPNPTTGIFTINLGNNANTINYSISSIEGRIIEQGKTSQNIITINLSDESKGIYFLRLNDQNNNKVFKIMKQ